jgi:hypothetical protein
MKNIILAITIITTTYFFVENDKRKTEIKGLNQIIILQDSLIDIKTKSLREIYNSDMWLNK